MLIPFMADGITWTFDRRALPARMRTGYAAEMRRGHMVLGMAYDGVAFVNLPAIRRFSLLTRVMEHEALHLVCGTSCEDVIEAMMR